MQHKADSNTDAGFFTCTEEARRYAATAHRFPTAAGQHQTREVWAVSWTSAACWVVHLSRKETAKSTNTGLPVGNTPAGSSSINLLYKKWWQNRVKWDFNTSAQLIGEVAELMAIKKWQSVGTRTHSAHSCSSKPNAEVKLLPHELAATVKKSKIRIHLQQIVYLKSTAKLCNVCNIVFYLF